MGRQSIGWQLSIDNYQLARYPLSGRPSLPRKRHPDPTIETALVHAEANGWRIVRSQARAHCWGRMYCPANDKDCRCGEFCITSIWSTPRDPVKHARQIGRVVDGCTGAPSERRHESDDDE
jgi:hypothetical protein